jgi:hypothetical protein
LDRKRPYAKANTELGKNYQDKYQILLVALFILRSF